ncbi:MAG: hypothetical protein ACFFCX_07235, partial [Candidatus Sifarchaeia archaeon]
FSARIYNGGSGALFTTVTPSSTYGLASGDFNGDGSADLVVMDSGSDIHMFEFVGGGSITINFDTGMVREFFTGDLYKNDNVDEVVVNLERSGAIAYSWIGTEVWRYNAPLVMGGKDTRIVLEDMNADGWTDLVVTNKEYINVVDGSTSRLMWHYWKADLTGNRDPRVGSFYSSTGRDVLCYGNDLMYIVAHDTTPPPVPLAAVLYQSNAAYIPPQLVLLVALVSFQLLLVSIPHTKIVGTRKKGKDTE